MALIPPFSFNCVVAIGVRESRGEIRWTGTGTLIGRFFGGNGVNQSKYHIFIVTNRHILENNKTVVVRFNPLKSQPAKDYEIPLVGPNGIRLWKGHPKDGIDIAAIGINADVLNSEGVSYSYFQSDNHLMPLDEMAEMGVSEGDFIYVLGFPMGIMDARRQYVIARSGIIARLRDTLEKRGKDFLIDASVFPGNSGGPVLFKPEMFSIEGTRSVSKAGLIGIVASYLTYKDTAVSQQTGQPRVIFEENSGLAVVIPVDYVMETVDACYAISNIKENQPIADGGKVPA